MKNLHKKIQVIKATVGAVVKTKENPFYHSSYADINDILNLLEPLFQEQNVLCLQQCRGKYVFTELIDIETGEKEDSFLEIPSNITDPQKVIACVTYFRRATLTSLLALQAEDDDGNSTIEKPRNGTVKAEPKKEKVWLTEDQFKITLKSSPKNIEAVLRAYSKEGFAMKKAYKDELMTLLDHYNSQV